MTTEPRVPRILIVEDEGVTAMDLERTVVRLGYQVAETCATGEEAVRLAAELSPDLVLMDIRLAGALDGIEAAARLREQADIPVVFLTAQGDQQTLARARAAAPYAYVLKPFDERELQISIDMSLYRHDAESRLKRSNELLEDRVARRTEELARKTRELELATRVKADFLRAIGHELRTPLHQIIGFAQLLTPPRADRTPEDAASYAGEILDAGNRMHALIENVLALASLDFERVSLCLSPVCVAELLRATGSLFADHAAGKGVVLAVEVAEDAHRVIEVDAPKVAHAIAQLVANAVKFTPAGGQVALRATPAPEDGGVEISVVDTGVGIPAERLAGLFDAFDEPGGATLDTGGLGVGLAIARRLVELHGSRLEVASEPGRGSTFRFTLRQRQATPR